MDQYTKAGGTSLLPREKVTEGKYGQMVLSMKASGSTTRPTVEVDLSMRTETFITENG